MRKVKYVLLGLVVLAGIFHSRSSYNTSTSYKNNFGFVSNQQSAFLASVKNIVGYSLKPTSVFDFMALISEAVEGEEKNEELNTADNSNSIIPRVIVHRTTLLVFLFSKIKDKVNNIVFSHFPSLFIAYQVFRI